MKLFIDTANIAEIRQAHHWGIIDGVTTNPTLVSRERRKFEDIIAEILEIVDGPISVEVLATDAEGMVKEARKLAGLHKNVVVKIPMTKDGLRATHILSREKVRVNMTLVFSCNQALLAAKVGAAYVSPFIGREDDIGQEGITELQKMVEIFKNYNFKSQIICASVRHPLHVIDAALAGCHVATVPFAILEKMVKHPLTDIGIERFLRDWGIRYETKK